jgi:hypothetical protein
MQVKQINGRTNWTKSDVLEIIHDSRFSILTAVEEKYPKLLKAMRCVVSFVQTLTVDR